MKGIPLKSPSFCLRWKGDPFTHVLLCFFFSESIRKVLDKQPIKFVRAVKQDLRSGKSEDRVLVRR